MKNRIVLASLLCLTACEPNDVMVATESAPAEFPDRNAPTSNFSSFADETARLDQAIDCLTPRIIDTKDPPALWQCIGGSSETVKLWVNETDRGGQVRNVKFLWNDWVRDGGSGIHADEALADSWVQALVDRYAPENANDVTSAFKTSENRMFPGKKFNVEYSYHLGPGVAERMLVITSK